MPAWKSHGLTRTLSVIIYFDHHPSADVDDDDDDDDGSDGGRGREGEQCLRGNHMD